GYYDYVVEPVSGENIRITPHQLHIDLVKKTGGWADFQQTPKGPPPPGKPDPRVWYLSWSNLKKGDELVLELPPLKDGGEYKVGAVLTEGPGSCTVQLFLNGEK